MCTRFDDLTVVHDEDHIGFADGGKPVRNDKAGSALHHFRKCVLNAHFRSGVNGGRRFVEDQHGRQRKHNARDTEKLLLSLGKTAVIADDGIVSLGEAFDEAMRVGSLRGSNDFCIRSMWFADRDILFDGRRLDPRVLKHHTVGTAQTVSRDIADVSAVHEDLTAVYVVKAHEQSDQRSFAATRRADDGNAASVRNEYGKITDQRLILRIGEGDITDVNITFCIGKNLCAQLIGCLRVFFYQFQETLRASHRVLKLRYDTGDLIKGLGILICIAEEDGETADRKCHGIGNDGKRADKTDAGVYHTVYNTGSGIDERREEYCLEGAGFQLLVHFLKGFDRLRFVTVRADDLFVSDDFIDIRGLLSSDLSLRGEEIVRTACNEARYKKGERRDQDDDESDLPVDHEHKGKRSKDGDHAREQLRKAHQQTVGELVGIRDDAADDIAVRIRVAIGNGELLQFAESGAAKIAHDTEGDLVIDYALNPLDQRGENSGNRDLGQNVQDNIHMNLAWLDNMVNGFTYGDRNIESQKNRKRGANQGEDQSRVIGANVGQNLSDRSFGNLVFLHAEAPSLSFGN